jgi:hypothetical protein
MEYNCFIGVVPDESSKVKKMLSTFPLPTFHDIDINMFNPHVLVANIYGNTMETFLSN